MEERMLEKTPDYFNVTDIFGENVFNDSVMQERLPKKVYKKLREVIEEGKELDLETCSVGKGNGQAAGTGADGTVLCADGAGDTVLCVGSQFVWDSIRHCLPCAGVGVCVSRHHHAAKRNSESIPARKTAQNVADAVPAGGELDGSPAHGNAGGVLYAAGQNSGSE